MTLVVFLGSRRVPEENLGRASVGHITLLELKSHSWSLRLWALEKTRDLLAHVMTDLEVVASQLT